MSVELEEAVKNVLKKHLAKPEIDCISQAACVVSVDHNGELVVTQMTDPIKITINSVDSFYACVTNDPLGLQFDIRDYGVDMLDESDDGLIRDDEGNLYTDMY